MSTSKLLSKLTESTFTTKLFAFRNMSAVSAKTLLYKEYGEPFNVLECQTDQVNKPEANQVILEKNVDAFLKLITI